MFHMGSGELLLIFFIALIFLGPSKLPELAKALGKSIKEFQKAKNEFQDELNSSSSHSQTVAHQNGQRPVDTVPLQVAKEALPRPAVVEVETVKSETH